MVNAGVLAIVIEVLLYALELIVWLSGENYHSPFLCSSVRGYSATIK